MPKGRNQKLKLYYLSQIMTKKTDADHWLSLPQIQELLKEYNVDADRKTLYDDLETLSVLGIDVVGDRIGHNYKYHVVRKHFDIKELSMLVEAVQSSEHISKAKAKKLTKKILAMASDYEAESLRHQVVTKAEKTIF